jgi:hypothetical protein
MLKETAVSMNLIEDLAKFRGRRKEKSSKSVH